MIKAKENISIPDRLTWLRIGMIPLILLVYYLPPYFFSHRQNFLAALIFAFASFTDWLDGYLARRLNQITPFGSFLDPVADKLMVVTSLLLLISLGRLRVSIAMIIIGREITISSLREWMAKLGKSETVSVTYLGKVKTTIQMLAIFFLLYKDPIYSIRIDLLGSLTIYTATILTLWTMFDYINRSIPLIQESN